MGKIDIVYKNPVSFENRNQAGRLLADHLSGYRGKNAVVLGVPRGGMIIAYEIAISIDADLDLVMAHKLGTPGHEELAMGSVSESGAVFLNEDVVTQLGISEKSIEAEKYRQMKEINRRVEMFRKIQPKLPLTGRIAIVTDDGVATGATTEAALKAVREENPSILVAAIPVGPEDTIARLAEVVDIMVCLSTPQYFRAVGQFYHRFESVEDDEVIEILKKHTGRTL